MQRVDEPVREERVETRIGKDDVEPPARSGVALEGSAQVGVKVSNGSAIGHQSNP